MGFRDDGQDDQLNLRWQPAELGIDIGRGY